MHSFSRKMRSSAVAAFTLMLVFGVVPTVAPTYSDNAPTPAAHAQSEVQAPVTVNSVTPYANSVFTITMTATEAMSMKNLEIRSTAALGEAATLQERELSVNGKQYPTSLLTRPNRSTLKAEFSEGVEVQPGTIIKVRWTKGQRFFPNASDFTATMRGTELASSEPPAVGNPTEAKNYRKLPNKRRWDACTSNNGLLYAKTWWDNSENTRKNGGKDVSVVEVAIEGASDLINAINTADPRLQLRFGSGAAGWTELQKDVDYTLTVSGNRIFLSSIKRGNGLLQTSSPSMSKPGSHST